MSLGEFALLDRFADVAGISDAAYLRGLIQREAGSFADLPSPRKRKHKHSPKGFGPPAADPALLLQIAKLGNLLNQIARSTNACRRNGSTLDVVQVLAVLLIVQRHIELLAQPAMSISPKDITP